MALERTTSLSRCCVIRQCFIWPCSLIVFDLEQAEFEMSLVGELPDLGILRILAEQGVRNRG